MDYQLKDFVRNILLEIKGAVDNVNAEHSQPPVIYGATKVEFHVFVTINMEVVSESRMVNEALPGGFMEFEVDINFADKQIYPRSNP